MKYQTQKRNLSTEQYTRFSEWLDDLENARLGSNELEFHQDMIERRNKYGESMWVSEAQYSWLQKIHERIFPTY